MRTKKPIRLIALILITAFMSTVLLGCGGQENAGENAGNGTQSGTGKQTVRLLYVEWACATATTHIIADILENELGYPVELTPVSAALMYEG